ncbi:MAG: hypothetical protein KZQ64_09905 [gamma proteobacterium symbiont of Bathyaustriella thionipta]|nr:hypothetical protein [gamma proteobacterium symbiont of Bathyaustriella thionipta]MCU7949226.1 hypothetical protein [gamma proteobacterium symbiont of Bathyaustriella thionipta]MCU7953685.1 hypothetical protein [gamma proteobacterium symbiont of Bathyaustriella thionipta]MCU7955814.1 hypothetical protein [gamma proteobacterium symbiont of Bathyaustriella thionipta]MCU7967290.1 hypothetical protein [gamma proteobacterium symbiont of Bathyaustriella thionipta]
MNQTQKSNATGSNNYQWAFSLIHYFALQGVTQAVISPGSRSTPLALACEKHPEINIWVQIDERSAGFFALGLAQKKHQPVILICTSGSAVANWFPAVVEASHSYTPHCYYQQTDLPNYKIAVLTRLLINNFYLVFMCATLLPLSMPMKHN